MSAWADRSPWLLRFSSPRASVQLSGSHTEDIRHPMLGYFCFSVVGWGLSVEDRRYCQCEYPTNGSLFLGDVVHAP